MIQSRALSLMALRTMTGTEPHSSHLHLWARDDTAELGRAGHLCCSDKAMELLSPQLKGHRCGGLRTVQYRLAGGNICGEGPGLDR